MSPDEDDPIVTHAATRGLLTRLLGDAAEQVVVDDLPTDIPGGAFEVEASAGQVVVRGSDGVAHASALNHYLKTALGQQLTWDDWSLDLPDVLPSMALHRAQARVEHRYYLNYCTFGYTMVWWDWERWQREIDWMALHGINLPLAITGLEATWQAVWRRFGMDDEAIRRFIGGPAHLPWRWMGCVNGWDIEMPQSWIDSHDTLGRRIVERERGLGMRPVQHAFAGHVPPELARPDSLSVHWHTFDTPLLDPADPRFAEVGHAFIDEQRRRFGTDHVYATDPFIEMVPPSDAPDDLRRLTAQIYEGMAGADPEATWILQGWPFHYKRDFWGPEQVRAVHDAVPGDRLVVLDLWAEQFPVWEMTESFHNKPWIWSMVHNYGARPGLFGNLAAITDGFTAAVTSPDRKKLRGTGMAMEGIENNPIAYELLTAHTWTDGDLPPETALADGLPIDVQTFTADFTRRRYGGDVEAASRAWQVLLDTVYSGQHVNTPPSAVFARPVGAWRSTPPLEGRSVTDLHALTRAWELLLDAADAEPRLRDREGPFARDLIDVTQQALAEHARLIRNDVVGGYDAGDVDVIVIQGQRFATLLGELDVLMATRAETQLGRWLAAARSWGADSAEAADLERNARRLITTWARDDSGLQDYAGKHWAGLIRDVYVPRWQLWVDALAQAVRDRTPVDDTALEAEVAAFEQAWVHATDTYPTAPAGDLFALSRAAHERHAEAMAAAYEQADSGQEARKDPTWNPLR